MRCGSRLGMEDEVECPCCNLLYPAKNPSIFPQRVVPLHPAAGVCWDCLNHLGESDKAMKLRPVHHSHMVRREYRAKRREIAELRTQLEESQRELAMRPVQTVVRVENLDQIVVDVAQQQRDAALRYRDVAMGALSDVRMLHHRNRDRRDRCECGKHYENCEMAQIADRWEGVYNWERSEAAAAYRGRRHHLHREHPALTDASWLRDVYRDAN